MVFSNIFLESIIHKYKIEYNLNFTINKKEKIIENTNQTFFYLIDKTDCYNVTTLEENNKLKYIILSIYTKSDFFREETILKIILNSSLNIFSYIDNRDINKNQIFQKILKESPIKDKLKILAGADQDTNQTISLYTDINMISFPFFSYLFNNLLIATP